MDFSNTSCLVLVIAGAKNKMTHPNIARRTAKNYRDSVLVSLMGADHMYESGMKNNQTKLGQVPSFLCFILNVFLKILKIKSQRGLPKEAFLWYN